MIRYVKSINDTCLAYGIKPGDVCKVISTYGVPLIYHFDKYYGQGMFYSDTFYARNFIPIDCPCDVQNCLKHRKQS